MLSRLFALVVLVTVIAAGLYYWKVREGDLPPGLSALGHRLDEAKLATSVKAAFELNQRLAGLRLRVECEDDVITLRGDVPDEETRRTAAGVAAAVPGVRQVVDHLRVTGSTARAQASDERTLGERVDDEALEVKARLALKLRKELRDTRVEVKALRRALTVSGQVQSAAQRDLVLEVLRELPNAATVTEHLVIVADAAPPAEALPGDARLRAEQALRRNASLAAYRLSVRSTSGRLVLEGRVGSAAEKELAGLVARDAAGTAVDNMLVVDRP
jgi:hyperosmotically inducible protein